MTDIQVTFTTEMKIENEICAYNTAYIPSAELLIFVSGRVAITRVFELTGSHIAKLPLKQGSGS